MLRHCDKDRNVGVDGVGDEFGQSAAFSFHAAEAADDDEVGTAGDGVGDAFRRACQPAGVKPASGRAGRPVNQRRDLPARQHENAEPWVLCPATAADLNEAGGAVTRPAQVIGEIDEHTIGIVMRSKDDSGQIALRVERHAASPLRRYIS